MSNEKPKYATFRDLHLIRQSTALKIKEDQEQLPTESKNLEAITSNVIDNASIEPKVELATDNVSPELLENKEEISTEIPMASNVSAPQLAVSAKETIESVPVSHSVPVALSDRPALSAQLALTAAIAGHTSIPNLILDGLFQHLRVQEQAVYLRLYRLSHGFHSNTCRVGFDKLAQACNISRREVIRAVEKLESLDLVIRLGCNFKAPSNIERGNLYQINLPTVAGSDGSVNIKKTVSANQSLSASQSPNKDDHDLLKKHDHHQKEVVRVYEGITGNKWKKIDDDSYLKIKEVPSEIIEQAIRLAAQRATSRPNSLAYFCKEILNLANPSKQSKAQQKKLLANVIATVRAANTGKNGYTISEFAADCKERCAREGVHFDNDLFNEIAG
jgi:hypothetical protein